MPKKSVSRVGKVEIIKFTHSSKKQTPSYQLLWHDPVFDNGHLNMGSFTYEILCDLSKATVEAVVEESQHKDEPKEYNRFSDIDMV